MDNNTNRRISLTASLVLLVLAAFPGVGRTQNTVTYTYDNLQRVTGASSSDGSSQQYQYDANGNVLTVTRANPTAAPLGQPLDVNLSVPGQSSTVTFLATAGQTITLSANSITTTPAGATVTFSVYNSGGVLVGTTSGVAEASLTLSSLPAGTYTMVVAPQAGATGVLQLALTPAQEFPASDAPLPLWAYVALALGLLLIAYRRDGELRARS